MKILWTDTAKVNVKEIYDYYQEVAGNKVAQSIKSKIIKKPLTLKSYPEIGQEEDNPKVAGKGFRYLVEGDYKIVYKYSPEKKEILIATVFDTRQNPTKMNIQ